MMGMRMPEICWAVFKRQAINLRNCGILLVDSFECMIMHGLGNPKQYIYCTLRKCSRVCQNTFIQWCFFYRQLTIRPCEAMRRNRSKRQRRRRQERWVWVLWQCWFLAFQYYRGVTKCMATFYSVINSRLPASMSKK
jgi:hypothetical protein